MHLFSVCGGIIEDTIESCEESYSDNEDGSTHKVYCEVCEYVFDSAEAHTYDDGVLSTDGTYYTYTCECCKYCYTEDVEEEDDDTDEETTEEETTEEDSEETTDDTSDSTDTTTDDSTTDTSTTDDSTTTDTSDNTTTSSTYTSAYIQYIGGILMSGNTSTSSTVEDVSTGAGMTAEGSTTSSALAVVSLMGVAMAMVVARKRK